MRINDLERKIANYEREIESLNRRLQDAQNSSKLTPGTPNTRIEGSISSGVGLRQDANTPLSESRNSSESGTARSGTYTPGQYSSNTSYGARTSGIQGAQNLSATGLGGSATGINVAQTGRISSNLGGQILQTGESGTVSYGLSNSGSVGLTGSGTRSSAIVTGGIGGTGGATYNLGGSSSVTTEISASLGGATLSGSGSVTGSGVRTSIQGQQIGGTGSSGYVPGQYSNYRRNDNK